MNKRKNRIFADGLEFIIIFSMIFMLISIYVPRAIWDEEEKVEKVSRFRMENVFNVEDFYHQLNGEYSADPLWAMNVVNAIRDSLTADSTYLDDQVLKLDGELVNVNIPKGWDVIFDTTFGFRGQRKDNIKYTQYVVVMYHPEQDVYDTSYVVEKNLAAVKENPDFLSIIAENPAERVELITYYDSYLPDSALFYCPLIEKPYEVVVENGIKISSPIKEVVKDRRYLIFSFRGENHGYIEDGVPSWN